MGTFTDLQRLYGVGIHKLRTLREKGSHQKGVPYIKITIFPIQKAYSRGLGPKSANFERTSIEWFSRHKLIMTYKSIKYGV